MSDELVTWLLAALKDDEKVAVAANEIDAAPWRIDPSDGRIVGYGTFTVVHIEDGTPEPATAAHIARHDPARVLAEIAAKRRILDEHQIIRDGVAEGEVHPTRESGDRPRFGCRICAMDDRAIYDEQWCPTLRLLALPLADRPGYKPEWSPDA